MLPPHHNSKSFGPINIVVLVLLAANLCALAYTLFVPTTLLVTTFTAVPSSPSVIFLAYLVGKIEKNLSSRLDTTETEHATLKREIVVKTEALVNTQRQRDDAVTKAQTTTDNFRKQRKIVDFIGKLAKAAEENDSKNRHIEKLTIDSRVLTDRGAVLVEQLAAAQHDVTVKAVEAKTKLHEQKLENAVILRRLAACTVGLAAANEGLVAKDAVVLARLLVAMDQGKTIATLTLNLEKSTALTQVDELQDAMASLQLSATPSHAATATKQDPTSAIPDDRRTGSSPVGGGSRTKSGISSSSNSSSSNSGGGGGGDNHDIVQTVASSPAIPAAPCPSNSLQDVKVEGTKLTVEGLVSAAANHFAGVGAEMNTADSFSANVGDDSEEFEEGGDLIGGEDAIPAMLDRDAAEAEARTAPAATAATASQTAPTHGTVQRVVSSAATPAAPSPSNAGAAPAVPHTGPHDKPKRWLGQGHQGRAAMVEFLLTQAYSAGKRVIEMVKTAKDCVDEGKEMATRIQSTLDLVEEAVPTFENDASLRKSLLYLKKLFEDVEDLLDLCVPQQPTSPLGQAVHVTKRVYFSEQNLKTLKEYSARLDRITLDFNGRMQLLAKQQANRMEEQTRLAADALLAMQITQDKGTDPSLKLAKRQLRGNVIDDELVEFQESLGSGSFGVVMAGTYYGKPVAIKRALSSVHSADDRERFRREASTHFALRHDRIVQVIAFRTGGGTRPPCLVMERMERTLYHFLGINPAPLDLSQALPYVIDICEGLKYLHQSGVIHRDIKSHNILLRDGGAKLSDFGLAHVCPTIGRSTGNGKVLDDKSGTQFWMAPEIYRWAESSFDSDIFSLHVVIWEILANRQGGVGPAIGQALLSNPHDRLPFKGEETESDPARLRLYELVRKCGRLDRKGRPIIRDVLVEAKDIFDSLSGPGMDGTDVPSAAAGSPPDDLEKEGGRHRPSDVRRREQHRESSKSKGGSWESWKDAPPPGGESLRRPRNRTFKLATAVVQGAIRALGAGNASQARKSQPAQHQQQQKQQQSQGTSEAFAGAADVQPTLGSESKGFLSMYRLEDLVHEEGTSSSIWSATVKRPGPEKGLVVAVKILDKTTLPLEEKEELLDMVPIWRSLEHPNVIHVYDFFEDDPKYYFLVMEHMRGGDLFDHGFLNEKEARHIFRMVLDAVAYCHDRGIVHRQVTPENMLMTSEHEDALVKLTNFGFACSILNGLASTQRGVPGYVAPEILRGEAYGTEVDMWSMGVTLYSCLGGYPPFHDANQLMLFQKIMEGKFEFHKEYWGSVSDEAKDLVSKLMTLDPKKRITASEAMKHPWMLCTEADLLNDSSEGGNLGQPTMTNARRKLRGAITTVLAIQILKRSCSEELKKSDREGPTSVPASPTLPQDVVDPYLTQEELKAEDADHSGGSEYLSSLSHSPGFHSSYRLGDLVHEGGLSSIWSATVTRPGPNKGLVVAVRRVGKTTLPLEIEEDILEGVRIWRSLEHHNVIHVYDFFKDDPNYYFLPMEYMRGGDVFDHVQKKGFLNEKEARHIFRMVLDAVAYCHDRGIVHRQVTPENMLMTSEHEDALVKLTGFDLACSILNGLASTQRGVPGYVAPETLRGEAYGTEVDMWSMGVTLYSCLGGYPPFHDANQQMLFQKTKEGKFEFHKEYWGSVSDEAKDLVRKLMTLDPKKRITASEAMKHPWMLRKGNREGPTSVPASPTSQQHVVDADFTQEELKAYSRKPGAGSASQSGSSEQLGAENLTQL
eukprot:g13493.t1